MNKIILSLDLFVSNVYISSRYHALCSNPRTNSSPFVFRNPKKAFFGSYVRPRLPTVFPTANPLAAARRRFLVSSDYNF